MAFFISVLSIAIAIRATYEYGGLDFGPVEDGDDDGVGVDDTPFTDTDDPGPGECKVFLLGLDDVGTLLGHLLRLMNDDGDLDTEGIIFILAVEVTDGKEEAAEHTTEEHDGETEDTEATGGK